jgi:lactoylglutathione lyase
MKRLQLVVRAIALVFVAGLSLHAADAVERLRIVGLAQVSLFVHDVEKSRAFYKEFLGFDEPYSLRREDGSVSQTWIKISDRQTIELVPEQAVGTDRLNRIALQVDDAAAMRRYLTARGVTTPDAISIGETGDPKFSVRDPDDHLVEFVQYVPDGWRLRERGKFLPESRVSTRISHVGLLVGDLDAGLAFYRGILGGAETWRGGANPNVLTWVNVKLPEGGDYLEFILYAALPAPSKRGGTHHLCLEVPDVEKTRVTLVERAARLGYTREIEIKTGINRRRQINLFDPDGTRVEVMEPNTVDGRPVPSSTARPPSSRAPAL